MVNKYEYVLCSIVFSTELSLCICSVTCALIRYLSVCLYTIHAPITIEHLTGNTCTLLYHYRWVWMILNYLPIFCHIPLMLWAWRLSVRLCPSVSNVGGLWSLSTTNSGNRHKLLWFDLFRICCTTTTTTTIKTTQQTEPMEYELSSTLRRCRTGSGVSYIAQTPHCIGSISCKPVVDLLCNNLYSYKSTTSRNNGLWASC